jgi:dTDP-4-dehydrorhamnose reductase
VKILIFGAGGILGQSLSSHFHATKTPFIGLTHATLDATQEAKLERAFDEHRPDVVINAAGMTAVDDCELQRDTAFAVNARAPEKMAKICNKRKIKFVHVSTDYVFDGHKTVPYVEDEPMSPISAYAESKAEGEKLVRQADPAALIVRVAWSFRAGGKSFLCKLRELVIKQKQIRVVQDRVGNCTYCPDLATAVDGMIQRDLFGRVIHFTNEGDLSLYDFAISLRETAERLGLKPQCQEIIPISVDILNLPAHRPYYSALDKSRYRQLTGNSIRHWRETLPDFLQS